MSVNVFPADAVSGSPSYTGRQTRQFLSLLVAGTTSARPFGGLSGVGPGTPTNTATSTSSTWTVKSHAGYIDAESSANAGGYFYVVNANVTGSVNAANATNPRIDLLSVQMSDPAESDGSSTPAATVNYTAGTAASSPSPPATPARSIALAQISVPAAGGGSPTVTWVAPYIAAAGGIVPCANSAAYPATPYAGMPVYDAAIDSILKWDGSNWTRSTRPAYYRSASFSASVADSTFQNLGSAAMTTLHELNDTGTSPFSVGTYTAAASGLHSAMLFMAGTAGATRCTVRLLVNGTEISGGDTSNGGAGRASAALTNWWLNAGDTINWSVYQNSGSSQTMTGYLSVRRG